MEENAGIVKLFNEGCHSFLLFCTNNEFCLLVFFFFSILDFMVGIMHEYQTRFSGNIKKRFKIVNQI